MDVHVPAQPRGRRQRWYVAEAAGAGAQIVCLQELFNTKYRNYFFPDCQEYGRRADTDDDGALLHCNNV